MSDAEIEQLQQLMLGQDASQPQTSAEWVQEAKECEAEASTVPEERVDLLCHAGHAWVQAGELDEAERCYQLVAAEPPESGMPDPRVNYAAFLLEHRDAARGDELHGEVWDSRTTEPSTYQFVAETFALLGDYERSLIWANAGVSRCYPDLNNSDVDSVIDDLDLEMLLEVRSHVRYSQGQYPDALDRLGVELREAAEEMLGDEDPFSGLDMGPLAILYWPQPELDEVLRTWPDRYSTAQAGTEGHTEYRRKVEGLLRANVAGHTPIIVPAKVADFRAYCAEAQLDDSHEISTDYYARHLANSGHGVVWPPGRNDPCWCTSGRKYKKCCGAPDFANTAAAGIDREDQESGTLVSELRDEERY